MNMQNKKHKLSSDHKQEDEDRKRIRHDEDISSNVISESYCLNIYIYKLYTIII